jgi:predicted Zn-dependent peptidase
VHFKSIWRASRQLALAARARRFCSPILLAGLLVWALPTRAPAQKVPVVEKQLGNGMRMLLVRRTDDPSVSGGWVVHVGSANERPGITGIAHLFEHMMFKGTPTIGTKDYQKDLEIIAGQERVREAMRQEERQMRAAWRRGDIDDWLKPENQTPRYRELEREFKQLVEQQRALLVKNEFDRIYTTAGASGMNAFTSEDITAYFITVPANKLELWMWMESERILRPVFREFYAERDVVFEERRMRTEATPLGRLGESFEAMFWESHPYGWPTVGWPSDIPAISKAQADDFYRLYYAPQNITLILVGDFDPDTADELAAKYFGRIPRGRQDPPEVVTLEIKQPGEKRLYGEAEANPQVDVLWHTVAFGHPDSYALQILAQLLSTRTGRLYKGLVLGSKVATESSARQFSRKWAGFFNAGGEAREGHTPEEVEQAIYAEIEKIKTDPVPAEELQKVKNNFAANEYRRLSSNMAILFQLIFNAGLGDWREINAAGLKIQAVTAEDVRRVANTYLTRESRSVAIFTRKAPKPASGPDLAGLTPDQQSFLRTVAAKVKGQTDAEALRASLRNIETQLGDAPPGARPFLSSQRKIILERLAELEKEAR